MSDGAAITSNFITITTVRCARCPHRFKVMNIDDKTEFKCPKCKCRHVKISGAWYDEKVSLLRKRCHKSNCSCLGEHD